MRRAPLFVALALLVATVGMIAACDERPVVPIDDDEDATTDARGGDGASDATSDGPSEGGADADAAARADADADADAPACTAVGLSFDGATAAMTVTGGVPAEIAGADVTKHVEAWIKPRVATGTLGVLHLGDDPGACGTPACGGVTLRLLLVDGKLALDVSQGLGASTVAVPAGAWTFVFAGFDAGVGYYVGKVEGGVVTRQSVNVPSITTSALAAGGASSIGKTLGGTFYDGAIDGVRIWSVALSDAEILARHATKRAANEAGLVRQWWMDEGTGATTLEDVTAAATATGGATWTQGRCP